MSSLTNHKDENPCARASAENEDWRRQVDEVQKNLSSKAEILLASLKPGSRQSIKDAIEQVPIIINRLQQLEKLQQSRLDDIRRCHDEWQGGVSDRTRELRGLDQGLSEQHDEFTRSRQRAKQQVENANRIGRELAALANQRVDALEKLDAIKKASAKHEESFRQEDIRLDERSATLDAREQSLQSQSADLIRASEGLNQSHRDLADKQEEERRRKEENKKRTEKITRRFDYLVNSQAQWEQQIATSASQVEELKADNSGLRDTKLLLETRVATLQREVTLTTSDVTRLEGNLQSQNRELSRLRTIEVEKDKLYTSMVHLTSVTLPEKEAEVNGFKADLTKTKDDTRASENEFKSRISKLDAEMMALQDQCQEQRTQIKELEEDHAFLQSTANESNAKIHELEQQSHKIHLDHNRVRQQLEKLQDRHNQQTDEARKSMALHDDLMKMEKIKLDAAHRRCHDAEQERDEVVEESIAAKAERDRFNVENHKLRVERDELQDQVAQLSAERDDLLTVNANFQQEKLDRSRILNETENEIDRLIKQPPSRHCSDKRSSHKRRHDQIDSDEEESSSPDESDRLARQSGKAPEPRASLLSATGHSDTARNSVSAELPESTTQANPGQTTRNAGPVMNTTATRALGTATPTIRPSDKAAFTFSVQDATLLNFSSDVLPNDVVQALRRKFRDWSAKTTFNWSTKSQSCIEARLERKKSEWKDGPDYACDMCERRMRLCVVVNSREQISLLPRKDSEAAGERPTDAGYWTR